MRAEARLDQPPKGAKDGVPQRVHLEGAARRGVASAIVLLQTPECPEAAEHLLEWARELGRGRTYGMHGEPHGISFPMIDAWCRVTGRDLSSLELQAVFAIDAAMLHPEEPKEGADG